VEELRVGSRGKSSKFCGFGFIDSQVYEKWRFIDLRVYEFDRSLQKSGFFAAWGGDDALWGDFNQGIGCVGALGDESERVLGGLAGDFWGCKRRLN
jgi:hypothetical protein